MNSNRSTTVRRLYPVYAVLLAGLLPAYNAQAQEGDANRGGRIAPPAALTCDRNQLTSWTGLVSGYRREADATWIEISTDERTVEQTTIPNNGSADASAHYLLWSEPFTRSDWPVIEAAPGQIVDGMRATAWICLDGETPPVIDWQPKRD